MVLYKERQNKDLIRVFIGLSFFGSGQASYALTYQNAADCKSVSFAPQIIKRDAASKEEFNYEYVITCVIKKVLEDIAVSKKKGLLATVHIYSGLHEISFLWEEEYLKEQVLPESVKNRDIWLKIIDLTVKNSIELRIFGADSMFNSINHSEKVRAADE